MKKKSYFVEGWINEPIASPASHHLLGAGESRRVGHKVQLVVRSVHYLWKMFRVFVIVIYVCIYVFLSHVLSTICKGQSQFFPIFAINAWRKYGNSRIIFYHRRFLLTVKLHGNKTKGLCCIMCGTRHIRSGTQRLIPRNSSRVQGRNNIDLAPPY